MWEGDPRLVASLTKNHQAIRSKMEILVDGVVVLTIRGLTPTDQVGGATALITGQVDVRRNEVRREADVTLLDLSSTPGALVPTDIHDVFAALRTEFRLWRGYQVSDASPYELATGTANMYWPIGTFLISKAKISNRQVALHGLDRLWNLRGRFQKPYSIPKGIGNMDALDALLRTFIPTALQDIQLPPSNYTTPAITWDQQDSILTRAHDLAIADGRVLYADPMGTIRAVDETVASADDVVWTFTPGRAAIHQLPEREIDATDAQNVVVASGESDGTTPPVTGTAKDMNPASLTYIGKVPEVAYFYSSPLLTTVDQCNKAAQSILARELGVADSVVVPAIPLPGLESGDVISVTSPYADLDSALLVADEFSVPLAFDGIMSIDCRTQVI